MGWPGLVSALWLGAGPVAQAVTTYSITSLLAEWQFQLVVVAVMLLVFFVKPIVINRSREVSTKADD